MVFTRSGSQTQGCWPRRHEWLLGILCTLAVAHLLHERLLKSSVVPAIERLRHGGEEDRVNACQVLGQASVAEALAAIPDLVVASKDPSPAVRLQAIDTLKRIGSRSEVVVSTLKEALDDVHPPVRAEAALALGMLGRDASLASMALRNALRDPSPEVRAAAGAGRRHGGSRK